MPDLGTVDLSLSVIQAPVIALDQRVGEVTHTSQVDLGLTVNIDKSLDALLAGARLRGTITVDPSVAGADAYPTSIRCAGASEGASIGLDANPVAVTASESLTLSAKVLLSTIDVLSVNVVNASVATTSSGGAADFAYPSEFLPDVGTGTTKRLGSATVDLQGSLDASSSNTTVLSIALPLATLLSVTNTALNATILPAIESQLLPKITEILGVYLGGGDVGPFDKHCDGLQLVGDKG